MIDRRNVVALGFEEAGPLHIYHVRLASLAVLQHNFVGPDLPNLLKAHLSHSHRNGHQAAIPRVGEIPGGIAFHPQSPTSLATGGFHLWSRDLKHSEASL
jgi:hypothetical protein